jgi:hypothetical protein
MTANNATVTSRTASPFGSPPSSSYADTFSRFVRSPSMANSSFGALAILMLVVAAAIFLLTPHDRGSVSFNPPALWSSPR